MHRFALVLAFIAAPLWSQEYSPALDAASSTRLYWGDLHVHSNLSPDAFAFGTTRLGAEDAYRFARGERVPASGGLDAQLRQPLDFLLVADHAEFLGVFPRLVSGDPAFLAMGLGSRWQAMLEKTGNLGSVVTDWVSLLQNPGYEQELSADFRRSIWQEAAVAADRNNYPGLFTAFVGYEWTSMVNDNNLHRVVLYRDSADKAGHQPPFSALDGRDPEQLWRALDDYENDTGGRVMSIPHNGNVSNGLMFALETLSGEGLRAGAAALGADLRGHPGKGRRRVPSIPVAG
jgi:hypothetical protein